MIRDQTAKDAILEQWRTVRRFYSNASQVIWLDNGAISVPVTESFPNLTLVLAVSVLDTVLQQLIAQGEFACTSWMLGAKMAASTGALPWQDYQTVSVGKDARNALAHEGRLLTDAECRTYVDAIGAELKAWGIITE